MTLQGCKAACVAAPGICNAVVVESAQEPSASGPCYLYDNVGEVKGGCCEPEDSQYDIYVLRDRRKEGCAGAPVAAPRSAPVAGGAEWERFAATNRYNGRGATGTGDPLAKDVTFEGCKAACVAAPDTCNAVVVHSAQAPSARGQCFLYNDVGKVKGGCCLQDEPLYDTYVLSDRRKQGCASAAGA